MYIGKHKYSGYDSSYYGSGKILTQAINKYGINNFSNQVLATADSLEGLNALERIFITEYKAKYGNLMYNIASGGDGGDTFSGLSKDQKANFVTKMTTINSKRCSSNEFKECTSKRMKEKYSHEDEREKQRIRILKAWSDKKLREQQSEKLKEYYKNNTRDYSFNFKACEIVDNGNIIKFESEKELKKYLKNKYNYSTSNPNLKEMLESESPFKPFFKRFNNMNGIILRFSKQNENVETMRDECNAVESEMSTDSKCKTI